MSHYQTYPIQNLESRVPQVVLEHLGGNTVNRILHPDRLQVLDRGQRRMDDVLVLFINAELVELLPVLVHGSHSVVGNKRQPFSSGFQQLQRPIHARNWSGEVPHDTWWVKEEVNFLSDF